MNTHYIPQLLLRQFAHSDKINTYDFHSESFFTKKLKYTFAEKDLFDEDLEKLFASKLEGPIGDLLNHKLLSSDVIQINRNENSLLRKFLMIHFLRSPIVNGTWEEMIERTKLEDHPSVRAREFLIRHHPELKKVFDKGIPSADSYYADLKMAMEYPSVLELCAPENAHHVSITLKNAASHAVVSAIAFWDSKESGQEFILPKLPGISMMDQVSILHKRVVIRKERENLKKKGLSGFLEQELNRLEYGSMIYSDNFSIYPISPTRILVCFSPYFRAFFPIMDEKNRVVLIPPILNKEQFDRHFFQSMRMELFEPCKSFQNMSYEYTVKTLTSQEVMSLNAMLLNMETEEFAFRDYNKIRDSFWYYDHKIKFAMQKKHNFSHMG